MGFSQQCLLKLTTYLISSEQLNHETWYPVISDDRRDDETILFPNRRSQNEDDDEVMEDFPDSERQHLTQGSTAYCLQCGDAIIFKS
jgi:hypothetical protein